MNSPRRSSRRPTLGDSSTDTFASSPGHLPTNRAKFGTNNNGNGQRRFEDFLESSSHEAANTKTLAANDVFPAAASSSEADDTFAAAIDKGRKRTADEELRAPPKTKEAATTRAPRKSEYAEESLMFACQGETDVWRLLLLQPSMKRRMHQASSSQSSPGSCQTRVSAIKLQHLLPRPPAWVLPLYRLHRASASLYHQILLARRPSTARIASSGRAHCTHPHPPVAGHGAASPRLPLGPAQPVVARL